MKVKFVFTTTVIPRFIDLLPDSINTCLNWCQEHVYKLSKEKVGWDKIVSLACACNRLPTTTPNKLAHKFLLQEQCEEINGVVRNSKLKENMQYNDWKKKDNSTMKTY
jgi:hypothetical protein